MSNENTNKARAAFDNGMAEGKAEAYAKIGDDIVKYAHQRGVAAGKSAVSKEFRERIGFGKERQRAIKAEVAAHFDRMIADKAAALASGDVALDA